MPRETPAERHDRLVRIGAERYAETYANLMKYMSQGGRTPGITVPTKAELLNLFQSTNPAYWQQLTAQDPQEAQQQLAQFKKVMPLEEENSLLSAQRKLTSMGEGYQWPE